MLQADRFNSSPADCVFCFKVVTDSFAGFILAFNGIGAYASKRPLINALKLASY